MYVEEKLGSTNKYQKFNLYFHCGLFLINKYGPGFR